MMELEKRRQRANETEQATIDQFTGDAGHGDLSAWEKINAGRYMPRRIRGSFKGRALG